MRYNAPKPTTIITLYSGWWFITADKIWIIICCIAMIIWIIKIPRRTWVMLAKQNCLSSTVQERVGVKNSVVGHPPLAWKSKLNILDRPWANGLRSIFYAWILQNTAILTMKQEFYCKKRPYRAGKRWKVKREWTPLPYDSDSTLFF